MIKIVEIDEDEQGKNLTQLKADSIKKETCNFCRRCNNCECELMKEKKKNDEKLEFQLDLSALNFLAFLIFFTFVFVCNTTIWLMISWN